LKVLPLAGITSCTGALRLTIQPVPQPLGIHRRISSSVMKDVSGRPAVSGMELLRIMATEAASETGIIVRKPH
jgi:hypothetical protein